MLKTEAKLLFYRETLKQQPNFWIRHLEMIILQRMRDQSLEHAARGFYPPDIHCANPQPDIRNRC